MTKPFAAEPPAREETLEILDHVVFALTTQGDPAAGAIGGEAFVVAFEARATPAMAGEGLGRLREHTDKPIKYLVFEQTRRDQEIWAELRG